MNPIIESILENARKRIVSLQFLTLADLVDFLEEESAFVIDVDPKSIIEMAIERGYFRIVSDRYRFALNTAIDYALELIVSGAITTESELRAHLETSAPHVAPWHKNRDVLSDLYIDARQKNLYRAIHDITRPIDIEQPAKLAG
jgi:hypothetical protein